MGTAAYNAGALSFGYYDNNANPHYGMGGDAGYTATGSKMWLATSGSLSTTYQGVLWGASNDGTGSGLDADLLDGQQGSYYYAASNPSGYTTSAMVGTLIGGCGFVTSSGNTIIGTDSDISLSGAGVISSLTMTDGVITAHATRNLTLANLGYTGATNANYITNNNQLSNGASYLTTSGKAADANLLDGLNSTAYLRDDGWNTSPGQDANTQTGMRSDFTYSNNAPHTGELIRFGAGSYSIQLNATYSGGGESISFRTRNGDSACWNGWNEFYHVGNKPSLATLGYTGATNANYITNNNQLSNSCGYTTCTGTIVNSQACMRINGCLLFNHNYGHGAYGLYSSTKYQHVWSMGTSYKMSADGSSLGALYGLAWTHTNIGGQSKAGLNHQLLLVMGGTVHSAFGTGMWTCGVSCSTNCFRAPVVCATTALRGTHCGNGAGLTSLNASNLSSGTVATARLPAAALCTGNVRSDTVTVYGASTRQCFCSCSNMATSSGDQSSLQVFRNGTGTDAFMTFHVGGDYALYFGLDGGTNKLSVGGWSMGAASYEIYHSGNKPSLATLGYTGATNANYITNNSQLSNSCGYTTCTGNVVNTQACIAVTCLSQQLRAIAFCSGGSVAHPSQVDYAIFRACGAWTTPYPDLVINYHTGIRFGAYTGYQGFRFFCNSTEATAACGTGSVGLLFSIGKGDAHTRVHCGGFYSCNYICSPTICATSCVKATVVCATGLLCAGEVCAGSVCGIHYGIGASLTTLNAGNLAFGTVATARLPAAALCTGTSCLNAISGSSGIIAGGSSTVYISHATGSPYNHIPANGAAGQFLGYSSSGTAAWVSNPNTNVTNNNQLTNGAGYTTCTGNVINGQAGTICSATSICGMTYVKTPAVCATACIMLSSGSNHAKMCNSVGFVVMDSTEGLLVRDNSANVFSARGSGNCSLKDFKACCNVYVCGSLSKYTGCFSIPHPDPAKNATHNLQHSFVESPTEGDNIYRWQVDTSNCTSVITLPSYYRHLNKNDMVWISPYRNFGSAYGEVTADQCCLIVCSNQDGCYNVLLIGTRKDELAESMWTGPEVLKPEDEGAPTGVPAPVHCSQVTS
jgi:hypothetical protein